MGQPAAYHHGVALLVALLSPPFGPDLAFVTELLSVYAWTSFVLVVATALLQRASMLIALVLAPLLLTAGAWDADLDDPGGAGRPPSPSSIGHPDGWDSRLTGGYLLAVGSRLDFRNRRVAA